MKRVSALSLTASLSLGVATVAAADPSTTYTEYLLSSGTVKLGEWQSAYEKAVAFVSGLSTAEKLSIITSGSAGNFTGINRLDSSTNPLGYYYVTGWPAGLAMSMTWDRDAILSQGEALGAEFKGKGIGLAHAPTLEPLGRSAWNGRTGETYGTDSYLAGVVGGQFCKGMSNAGVIPAAKHFIMNEYETNRLGSGNGAGAPSGPGGPPPSKRQASNDSTSDSDAGQSYSVNIDDKAFHETYLAPFYDTIKNGAGGMMCAMNRVNSSYACESQDMLGKYLKVELGFPGQVYADVGAQHTAIGSANAGMDLAARSVWSNSTITAALTNGSFTPERLDDMATRVMIGYYKLGQDAGYPSKADTNAQVDVRGSHSALARTYAANSIALLKNTNNALPLKNKSVISIFGSHAAPRYVGPNTGFVVYGGVGPTMQGHMAQIGGSGMASLAYQTTPVQLFVERAVTDGFMLKWWLNDTSTSSSGGGFGAGSAGSGTQISETTTGIASGSDACVVFINSWAGEGGDRSEIRNVEQDTLATTVADNCNNTIVVINTVGPRLVDAWIEHENVTGVLYGGPLGQESGNAIDDVLFGAVNPSGKLVHTIAKNESDYDQNTLVTQDLQLDFTEGNYIDYKYFDKYNVTPRYEFGYGLSYTTFEYTNTTSASGNVTSGYATGALAVGGREDLWDTVASVTATISNTGSVSGAEVAQLYVSFPDAADEPIRQLRGFQKVTIQPGESVTLTFPLARRDLSIWDVTAQNWKIESGAYTFSVGSSSRHLRATASLTVS